MKRTALIVQIREKCSEHTRKERWSDTMPPSNVGGGMTETALALNARDYKGLSGSNQMMTAAAMLIGENDV